MKDSFKLFINLNALTNKQLVDLWNFVFDRVNQFSFRFPNYHHSTSNIMKIKYDDNAQIDEAFCDYLEKNKMLINKCENNKIKKEITNRYFNDKYSNLSIVYHCKMFDYLKEIVYRNPNLFNWLEPDLPEDLSFLINGKLFVYVCSHEDLCVFYVNSKDRDKILECTGNGSWSAQGTVSVKTISTQK